MGLPEPESCSVHEVHPGAVERARVAVPEPEVITGASEVLKAIGDPTRIRILSALRAVGSLCVCDLAEIAGISESAVSHQLRLLRSLRLVAARKEGRQVFYSLTDDHVSAILDCALSHAQE